MICQESLRFARTFLGLLVLLAYFLNLPWLVLLTALLMIPSILSIKYSPSYQFYLFLLRKLAGKKTKVISKELGEIRFACGMGASFLFISYFLLAAGYTTWGWILAVVTALIMLLAGLVGVCVASLMYASVKKLLNK